MTEERRLTAIMFTDVCGFSTIMGEDESRAISIVEAVNSCVHSGTQVYGGRIIKKLGDGLLVEFSSAVNAVRCALEIQRAVADYNARSHPKERFELRIGIHVGDVVVAGDDILGDGVNVASRIQPLAEPGGICISRDVFDLISNKIAIETVYLGPHDLKNIARQVDIYKVLIAAVSQSGKTVVRNKGSSTKRSRTWLYAAAGIAAVLAVLVVLLAIPIIRNARLRKKARVAFEAVSAKASELNKAGNPAEALKVLESYPAAFSHTEWHAKVDALKAEAERQLDKKVLGKKQMMFLRAVESDDKPTAVRMLDPAAIREMGEAGAWVRLRMTAALFKIAKVGTDNVRIGEIFLSEDGLSAVVSMQVRKPVPDGTGEVWNNAPPSKWKKINREWLLSPDPPVPAAGQDKPRPPRHLLERKASLEADRRLPAER